MLHPWSAVAADGAVLLEFGQRTVQLWPAGAQNGCDFALAEVELQGGGSRKACAVGLPQGGQQEPGEPRGELIKCHGFKLIGRFPQAFAQVADDDQRKRRDVRSKAW